ncbi:MAG: Nif3-like dinuclear metal center hexameric protein [bacterium]
MPRKITVKNVHDFLARFAPPALAEEWDNVGLQIGSLLQEVRGILVSLDVTEPVLEEGERLGANLLVTHHPLFFRSVKRLDDSTLPMRYARLAFEKKINVLSFHTNLDSTEEGLNDRLAKLLRLRKTRPLQASRDSARKKAGLGRVGEISKTSLKKIAQALSSALSLEHFRYVGDPLHPVRTVAVMTGSGGGFFREAKGAGADVLVTGDVKYHDALDAKASGIALIDIGHFASEIGMVRLVAGKLREWARKNKSRVKIFESRVQRDPFSFWV